MNDRYPIAVVRVAREHLSQIAELERACFADPWSEQSLELLLTDTAVGMVAVQGNEVLGYGGMLTVPGEGQITNLATAKAHRRRGVGAALLEALCSEAERLEAEQISLEVRVSNEAAIALYTARGFAIAGVRKHFYRAPVEDAYVMIKRL